MDVEGWHVDVEGWHKTWTVTKLFQLEWKDGIKHGL